jgi:hypothetical protein
MTARELERRRELVAEVVAVLPVDRLLAERQKRPPPPLHVVVAGYQVHWRRLERPPDEGPGTLELPMPCPLGDVAGDHHRVGPQVGDDLLQRLHLPDIGGAAEMQVGEVEQLGGHDSICTV